MRAVLEIICTQHANAEQALLECNDPDMRAQMAGCMLGHTEIANAILKEVDQ